MPPCQKPSSICPVVSSELRTATDTQTQTDAERQLVARVARIMSGWAVVGLPTPDTPIVAAWRSG